MSGTGDETCPDRGPLPRVYVSPGASENSTAEWVVRPENWWVIHRDDLLALLHRAAAGEDPELLLVEDYANANHEHVSGDDND